MAIKNKRKQKPQKAWLRREALYAATRTTAIQLSPGAVRLLTKREVCEIAHASYPSIWSWMRRGIFPRARIVNGRSMWLSTDIEAWLAALPVRKLKGDVDPPQEAA